MVFFVIPLCFFPSLAYSVEKNIDAFSAGVEYFELDQYEKALEEFVRYLETDPSNAQVHYYAGVTLSRLQNEKQAIAYYEKALELNPELKGVHSNLGISFYKAESYDSALKNLHLSLTANPKNSSARFFLGLTYMALGKYQDAITHFEKSRHLNPSVEQTSIFNIGLAYYRLNKIDLAKKTIKEALEINPNSNIAKDARELLGAIDQGKKFGEKKSWSIKTNVSWQFDDNLSVVEQDTVSEQSDTAYIFQVSGKYRFPGVKDFSFETHYDFFNSAYEDFNEFNFQSHSMGLLVSKEIGDLETGVNYNYVYMRLDEKDFLGISSFTPSLSYFHNSRFYSIFYYSFQDKNFFEDEPRDGVNHVFTFNQFVFFLDNRAYALLGYTLNRENVSNAELDYVGNLLNITFQLPLWFKSKIHISYKYNLRNYNNITSSIGENRRDEKQTVKMLIKKEILKNMILKLEYENINTT